MPRNDDGRRGCLAGLGCVATGCAGLAVVALAAVVWMVTAVRQANAWARADLLALDEGRAVAEARALDLASPALELRAVDREARRVRFLHPTPGASAEAGGELEIGFDQLENAAELDAWMARSGIAIDEEAAPESALERAPGGLPLLAPQWVPVYPASALRGWESSHDERTGAGGYQLLCPDAVEAIVEHYQQALGRAGLDRGRRSTTWNIGARSGATLAGRGERGQLVLRVTATHHGSLIAARFRAAASTPPPSNEPE